MPLAFIPITVMCVMVGVGIMPMVLGVTLMRVRPLVIMVCDIHAFEVPFVIRMPAVAPFVTCSVRRCRRCTEKYGATKG
jgi:hypothetical protein